MKNLPALQDSKQVSSFEYALDYTDRELLDALKKTVAKDTTDAEFKVFIELCRFSGLNPLQKEIWCFKSHNEKSGEKLITMSGINGFLQVANSHPAFDGLETECKDPLNPVAVTCRVYRKDRSRPSVGTALLKEFKGTTPIWNYKPYHMLCKVAKAIALREAFSQRLAGIYIPEEYQKDTKLEVLKAIEAKAEPEPEPPKRTREDKIKDLLDRYQAKGVSEGQLLKYIGRGSFEKAQTPELKNLLSILLELEENEDVLPETWFPTASFDDSEVPTFEKETQA